MSGKIEIPIEVYNKLKDNIKKQDDVIAELRKTLFVRTISTISKRYHWSCLILVCMNECSSGTS